MVNLPAAGNAAVAAGTREDVATTVRTALWHLRKGGLPQVRSWAQSKTTPKEAAIAEPGFGATGTWVGTGQQCRLQFAPTQNGPGLAPRNPEVRAAVILDDFSALALGSEWDCTQLSRKSWREQVQSQDFNILFVESAWSGFKKQWSGKLDGASHQNSDLADIVAHFRENGIPTVFWNKEDPVHYGDFLAAAQLFDQVFTTDADRIPNYQRDLGHDRVGLLPFAAQPRLHNPIRPAAGWHERDIAFGGMYFSEKYDSRRGQMDLLLGTAARLSNTMEHGLEIFSRQLGGAAKYQFPAGLAQHVVGSLDYPQMLTAYKAYKAMLNVNTVTESSSMCARRVFEILASGTNVISTPSKALTELFGPGEIHICATEQETAEAVATLVRDPFAAERGLHLAQRRIWQQHTYRHRCETVLSAAAPHLGRGTKRPRVTAVVVVENEREVERIFQTIGSQVDVDTELVLVVRGFEMAGTVVLELQEEHDIPAAAWSYADSAETRGACLNRGIEAASGEVLAIMNPVDHYGPNYLSDQLHALEYSEADVVGKQAYYSLRLDTGKAYLKARQNEHHWTTAVQAATLTAGAGVFRSQPFADLEQEAESGFLAHLHQGGGSIYSADRFNYLRMVQGGAAQLAAASAGGHDASLATHKHEVSL
ncbi:hypothetical protein ART_1285 [Arthrobacter sp. PAMC 25486]|uniref:glycosyltransferase family protein n=1 Tax=Arthrobacter sp. PAMC 25486 TaxID=1494608 RepID=UPI000535E02C|nr:glycosyltransferase [Arthrobacter sp. PAMC 25486]AIY00884.1 hypothetical protein ART_1285 [Arthrobacter sp. PAMC 25486]